MTPQQLAALNAAEEGLRVLRASLADPEPTPAPVPAPPPVEPPPPPPPPIDPQFDQAFERRGMNRTRLVFFDGWHRGSVYQRYQDLTRWSGDAATVLVRRENVTGWSSDVWRPAKTYTLLVDGQPASTTVVKEGAATFTFSVDLRNVAPGWRRLDIGGLSDGESCPTWFAFRKVPGMAMPERMPVVGGSYELSEGHAHAIAWVPARYKPRAVPLPRKTYTPFATAETKRLRTDLVVAGGHASVFLPNVTADGIVNTFNLQSYYWTRMLEPKASNLHLDGPRGVGTHHFGTHIELGVGTQSADPSSAPMLAIYVCEPKRIIRVAEDGHITTLAGQRHKGIGSYYGDDKPATVERVGNWDAVPEKLRGFLELWGFTFDPASLGVDTSAAPIPAEGNRQPHSGNPVAYASDTQRDCVYRMEFDGKSHATPVKISVLAQLEGAFDVRMWRDEIIVSQQRANRIVALDRDGTLKRVIVQRDPALPGGASYDAQTRRMWRQGTLEQVQAHPVVSPEGLYILPGDDWLYYAGQVQSQIRRVHLVTGKVERYMNIETDGNSHFCKFAMSDGTAGPRGSVFYQVWSNTNTRSADMGARLPDGSFWNLAGVNTFNSTGYGSAVGVGGGRIYTSSSEYGLRKKYLADPINASLFDAGRNEWVGLHGDLRYGPYGLHCDESVALPWGKSAAIDYFLQVCGHAAPAKA